MQHAHRALSKPRSNHLFDLANGGEFSAFARLLQLDLTGEEAPEDLGDELVVRVGLSAQNLL